MFECTECGRRYTRQNSLSRHVHNHRKTKGHACSECNVVFYRRDLLSRHMKLHSQSADTRQTSPGAPGASSNRPNGDRKRCHTACTQCRALRIKCSGTSPCSNCLNSGHHCDYEHSSGRVSHPQGETAGTSAEPEPGYQKSPEIAIAAPYEDPATQYQTLPTPDSALLPSLGDVEPMPSSPSAGVQAVDIPSVEGTTLVTNLSQEHIANHEGPYQDLPMLDLDVLPWPLLHENLYLPMEFDFPATGSLLDPPPPETYSAIAEPIPPPELVIENPIAEPTLNRRPNISEVNIFEESAQIVSQADYSINAVLEAPSVRRVVRDLILHGLDYQEESNRTTAARDHSSYWTSVSGQVASAFRIYSVPDPSNLLHHLVDLYFQNFEPLWPLFSPQNLNINQLHPLLFLVLTSIGAMYGDSACGQYGTMMHNQIRVSLAGPLELGDTDADFTWLLQARSHTKVAALYFGQPKAFSFAQHLGALIVGQARRMGLFSSTYADTCERHICQPGISGSDADQRQALWLHLEGRRRLAFAIFRAETYTSVLLQKKPLLTMKDINLTLPSCDAVWGSSENLSARLCLDMIKHDRSPSRHLLASDIINIALERDEPLPPLDAAGYEMLLFGLQSSIWRFSSDPGILHRLTGGNLEEASCKPQSQLALSLLNASWPLSSEIDYLTRSTRKMLDLSHDYKRLLCALQKCEASLPLVRAFVYTDRDRMSLMSSLILLHLGYLLLYTPIDSLHQVQYMLADGKTPDSELLDAAHRWANTPRARLAAERAVSIWTLIANSKTGSHSGLGSGSAPGMSLERDSGRTQNASDNGKTLQFNLVAFLGLHHSAVLLWAYAGASEGANALSMSGTQEADWIEEGAGVGAGRKEEGGPSFSCLKLPVPRSLADAPIPINRDNASKVLQCFVWAYGLISPSRWSSFAKAATALSEMPLPPRKF